MITDGEVGALSPESVSDCVRSLQTTKITGSPSREKSKKWLAVRENKRTYPCRVFQFQKIKQLKKSMIKNTEKGTDCTVKP